jgi:hypothetical protein
MEGSGKAKFVGPCKLAPVHEDVLVSVVRNPPTEKVCSWGKHSKFKEVGFPSPAVKFPLTSVDELIPQVQTPI